MPHRKRRQARELKYHHFEEFGTSPTPQPFLKPALEGVRTEPIFTGVDPAGKVRDLSVRVVFNADGYYRGLERAIETTGRFQDDLLRRDLGRKTMPW